MNCNAWRCRTAFCRARVALNWCDRWQVVILKRPALSERPVGSESKGEMSEWLKEHAWKAIRARLTEWYRKTCSRNDSTTSRRRMLLDVNP
jgi:hypothetical protein